MEGRFSPAKETWPCGDWKLEFGDIVLAHSIKVRHDSENNFYEQRMNSNMAVEGKLPNQCDSQSYIIERVEADHYELRLWDSSQEDWLLIQCASFVEAMSLAARKPRSSANLLAETIYPKGESASLQAN